jgi:tRNA modification GTPase
LNIDDTIAAIASAPGGAMRGVVRLSGPDTLACLQGCFQGSAGDAWMSGEASSVFAGSIRLPTPLGVVPCELLLWPGTRSYTRQPVAELHTIGSPPLLDAALRAVCAAGARLAEPGEFTLRAFLAGRLDLTQAEAVLGVVDAHNRREFQVALSQLAGGIAGTLQQLRSNLLDLLAHLEAGLDFVEEDIQFISAEQLESQLDEARRLVTELAGRMNSRGVSPDGFRVVLVGWPNVGKSSLMNALVGQPAAIVSHVPGTTRDFLTRLANIHGLPCLLIDTAGRDLEAHTGSIDDIAQRVAAQQAAQADVEVLCIDATRRMNDWERETLTSEQPRKQLLVLTKIDGVRSTDLHLDAVETSSKTGVGITDLRRAIYNRICDDLTSDGVVAGTAVRCRESVRKAAGALERALLASQARFGEEIVAAETRLALDELAKIVGAVYTEDILDRIFSRFCIGK